MSRRRRVKEFSERMQQRQLLLPWAPRRTVNTADAAILMDCCEQTVRHMIEDGTLKAYKLRPKLKNSPFRVFMGSIEKHMEAVREELHLADSRSSVA